MVPLPVSISSDLLMLHASSNKDAECGDEHMVHMQLMVVKPGSIKRIFAPYKGARLSTLSWDPPPTPPGVRKRKAAEMAAAAFVIRPPVQQQPVMPHQQATQHDESCVLPGPPARGRATEHSQSAAAQQQSDEEEEKDEQAGAVDSSSDEGVVDFMSDDEDQDQDQADGNKATALGDHSALSRFDDSEDEDKGLQIQEAPQKASAAAACPTAASDLSRFDDSDDATPMQAATIATAAADASDLLTLHDSHSGKAEGQLRQGVTGSSQQRQTHADALRSQPAASLAAAAELSRSNDSGAKEVGEEPEVVTQPVTLSSMEIACAPATEVGSGASLAPEAASQPAATVPSSSPSDPLTSQHESSSDTADMHNNSKQQKLEDDMKLLRNPQLHHRQPELHKQVMSTEHQQQQCLGRSSDADSDNKADSGSKQHADLVDSDSEVDLEADCEVRGSHSQAESSDESGAEPNSRALRHSGNNQQDELSSQNSEPLPAMHTTLRLDDKLSSQQVRQLLGNASDASVASEDSMQAEAAEPSSPIDPSMEGAPEEGDGLVVAPADSPGAANPGSHMDGEHMYPGDSHVNFMLHGACGMH